MTNYNAANERIKRRYFAYLVEAQGHSEQTIDAVAKAIARFEAFTRYKDFRSFHIEQAKAFKRDLADQRAQRGGEPLSKATLYATLTALKRFFVWLAGQPGYKSRIAYADAEYFNLSTKDVRIAKAIVLHGRLVSESAGASLRHEASWSIVDGNSDWIFRRLENHNDFPFAWV
jgi:integrase family protein with SAM-like domain